MSATEIPTSKKSPKIAGDTDSKSEEQKIIEERLRKWLEQSASLIDESDPCYGEVKNYMHGYTEGADRKKLKELEGKIKKCGDENSQTKDITRRNFAILESQTSYDKSCGGDQAQKCKDAQDKVAEYLKSQGQDGWIYSGEILWAYDQNGEIIDAASFPGYQTTVDHGDHKDVLSISVQWTENGNTIYGLGISSQNEAQSAPVIWGSPYTSLEDLSKEIDDILVSSENPIPSHD